MVSVLTGRDLEMRNLVDGMTRNQISDKIYKIILEHTYDEHGEGSPFGIREATEEIMELWDQGFVYDLEKKE